MNLVVRAYQSRDHEPVLKLSLRAWAPVFASVNEVLGPELSTRLHGKDWREHQSDEVRAVLGDTSMHVWVGVRDSQIAGFVAARVTDDARALGEVVMLAVEPAHQRRGVGSALLAHAVAFLRGAGCSVAVLGSGGDPGHAPARAMYEQAGFSPFPIVQFFKYL